MLFDLQRSRKLAEDTVTDKNEVDFVQLQEEAQNQGETERIS